MADQEKIHDGRFGEKFDDEINIRAVVLVVVGLAVVTALGFVVSWGTFVWSKEQADAWVAAPSVLEESNARQVPSGPVLQAEPEVEMKAMRSEMAEALHGYGWRDEGAGIVHIPIADAIDLALERSLIETATEELGAAPAEESAEEPIP